MKHKLIMWLAILFIGGFVISAEKVEAVTISVNSLYGGFKDDKKCSLFEAVLAANTDAKIDSCIAGNGADEILIDIAGEIKIDKTVYIDSDIILRGNKDGTIINGKNAWTSLLIQFNDVTISDIEFVNANRAPVIDISTHEKDIDNSVDILLNNLYIHGNNGTAISYRKEFDRQQNVVVRVNNSLIEKNNGEYGGGVFVDECMYSSELPTSLYINNSIIRNNSSAVGGGGVYNKCGHVVISNSTITDNEGIMGGGIFIDQGRQVEENIYRSTKTEIYNTTIEGNMSRGFEDGDEEEEKEDNENKKRGDVEEGDAEGDDEIEEVDDEEEEEMKRIEGSNIVGAGIYVYNNGRESEKYLPEVVISNSTVANNQGGGIFADNSNMSISNSVIADNRTRKGEIVDQCEWHTKLGKNIKNMSSDKTCQFKVSSDIELESLNKNGGSKSIGPNGMFGYIETMAIGKKSSLFNNGDNKECLKEDARGVSRPQGKSCDIGAFELKGPVKDKDRDGILDEEESAGPNKGDINKDGILDIEQSNVTTYKNSIIDEYVAVELIGGECTKNIQVHSYQESDLPDKDPDYEYTLGLHGDNIKCDVKGGTATIVYYWDKKYDTNQWQYRKYIEYRHIYVDFSDEVTYGIADVDGKQVTTVTFQVTDGGKYDSDGVANGIIIDPAGPVMKNAKGNSSIGNTVWLDTNSNGKQDVGEEGLENIRVKLIWYGPDGEYNHGGGDDVILRTDTNHNGHYIFERLPEGKYKVTVKESDVRKYVQTYENGQNMNGEITIVLKRNSNFTKADFGYNLVNERLAKSGGNMLIILIIILGVLGIIGLKLNREVINRI